jgi:hypothetical protein
MELIGNLVVWKSSLYCLHHHCCFDVSLSVLSFQAICNDDVNLNELIAKADHREIDGNKSVIFVIQIQCVTNSPTPTQNPGNFLLLWMFENLRVNDPPLVEGVGVIRAILHFVWQLLQWNVRVV